MRKGFIQAKEFGFHPEGNEVPVTVCKYILLFQILETVVVDTWIGGPWIRTQQGSGWP